MASFSHWKWNKKDFLKINYVFLLPAQCSCSFGCTSMCIQWTHALRMRSIVSAQKQMSDTHALARTRTRTSSFSNRFQQQPFGHSVNCLKWQSHSAAVPFLAICSTKSHLRCDFHSTANYRKLNMQIFVFVVSCAIAMPVWLPGKVVDVVFQWERECDDSIREGDESKWGNGNNTNIRVEPNRCHWVRVRP